MVIICDISAWQYWRCPPLIREGEVPTDIALVPKKQGGLGLDRKLLSPRANAREADRLLSGHILGDLKGVELPVHVMIDRTSPRRDTGLATCHRAPAWLSREHVVSLGNGLGVLSIPALLETLGRQLGPIDIAGAMNEVCGTYALFHRTNRSTRVINPLLEDGTIKKLANRKTDIIRYFHDESGKRATFRTKRGKELPWQPTLTNNGTLDDLWKRPPLVTLDELELFADAHPRSKGSGVYTTALGLAREGLASPFENQIAIALTAPAHLGGEALPVPLFNRKIGFTDAAQKLAGTTYCIGDAVWDESRTVVEANGYDYHTDDDGFYIKSGRTSALQLLGYTVHEMNYAQFKDQEQYEGIVESICISLGTEMQPRTKEFKRQNKALREALLAKDRIWA